MPHDIVEAAGALDWSAEQPGRWHVEARQTHVVVVIPGGTAMLTPHDAALMESALSIAKSLVHGAMIRADQMRMGGVAPQMPGAEG